MKGRLAPGRIFLVDTEQKRLISDEEVKKQLAARQPYAQWLKENQITLDHLPSPTHVLPTNHDTILMRQRAFGYTDEDLKTILSALRARRRGAGRLDGNRHAAGVSVRQAATAVQLFQADVRAGHQSGDRFDSRRAGDVAQLLHRKRRKHPRRDAEELPHAEAAPSGHLQLAAGKAAARELGQFPGDQSADAVPRQGRRRAARTKRSKRFAAARRWRSSPVTRC